MYVYHLSHRLTSHLQLMIPKKACGGAVVENLPNIFQKSECNFAKIYGQKSSSLSILFSIT